MISNLLVYNVAYYLYTHLLIYIQALSGYIF